MTTITRRVHGPIAHINGTLIPPAVKTLVFEEEPCSYEQACAHLEIYYPNGYIVIAPARGPRGGWGGIFYVSQACGMMKTKKRTLHLARVLGVSHDS